MKVRTVPAAKHELFYYDTVAPDCSAGNGCGQLCVVAAHFVLPLAEMNLRCVVRMKMDVARICRWGLEPDRNDFILQDKVLAARNIDGIKCSLTQRAVFQLSVYLMFAAIVKGMAGLTPLIDLKSVRESQQGKKRTMNKTVALHIRTRRFLTLVSMIRGIFGPDVTLPLQSSCYAVQLLHHT